MKDIWIVTVLVLTLGATTQAGEAKGRVAARRLNNFVVHYVKTDFQVPSGHDSSKPYKVFQIDHFRDGWLLISGRAKAGGAWVAIDSDKREDAVLTLAQGHGQTMRYVSKGKHQIRLFAQEGTGIEDFTIRSIPELVVCEVKFAVEKPYEGMRDRIHDWDFYQKKISPNINVIISDVNRKDQDEWKPYATQWRSQGKRWLFKTSQPVAVASITTRGKRDFEEYYFNDWTKHLKTTPYIDGTAVDEWTDAEIPQAYESFANILDRFAQDPLLEDKHLYIFGIGPKPWHKPGIEAIQRNRFALLKEGYFYLRGSDDEAEQTRFIASWAGIPLGRYFKDYPGFIQDNLVYVVSTSNYHYSMDITPDLDFKVFLDIQFHHYANYPTLRGMYGICLYALSGTSTDMLLYGMKLIRHYCIEGRRGRMTNAPLRLPHLTNPGFEQDLEGWQAHPIEAGGISVVPIKEQKYQNRFWPNQVPPSGAKMLQMVRSASGPNTIQQKIVKLIPGKLYSMALYVSDYSNFGRLQLVPISIELEGVEEIVNERESEPIYTRDYKNFDGRGCWNYHRRVFRAKKATATLTLCDWGESGKPEEGIGNTIMWDHIKVQPHYVAPASRP
ncbi:MAG: hypothetical protein ACE5FD_00930 [Anaerolineae bacterium]